MLIRVLVVVLTMSSCSGIDGVIHVVGIDFLSLEHVTVGFIHSWYYIVIGQLSTYRTRSARADL